MSHIGMIIEERAATLGSFLVGRLLPFREKRSVGPFVFIDHMGPAHMGPNESLEVPPHPHIGLSTLTYLFEGSVMHRDSLGTAIEIQPGAVNWMTAGKGITHSERTPSHLRGVHKSLHGLQIWVALPTSMEQAKPSFTHIEKERIPFWEQDGLHCRLIAGEIMDKKSPVPVYSPLYLLEIEAKKRTTVKLGNYLFGESGLYILNGAVYSEGNRFGQKQILISLDSTLCNFEIEEGTVVYIFGGEPFPEERFIHWNFVASDKALIEKAKADWEADRFPKVPGESERVPYPRYKS